MEGNCETLLNLSYEELELVLSKIISTNPNKEDIAITNQTIKNYSKNILCVEGFFMQIEKNLNFKIRQLSAILLYRKLDKHWRKMTTDIQMKIVSLILELLIVEKNYLVLKAIANLVYRIAKMMVINEEWTDLLEYIFNDPSRYSSDQANLLELNLYIISQLLESCAFHLKSKFDRIKLILQVSLNHGNQKMKEFSTKCIGNLVRSLEKEELIFFKDLIPHIFNEIKNFTEDTVLHIYETFCDFHLNSLDFFDAYFDEFIIPYSLQFLQNLEFNGNTKLVISEFLLMIAECKKKTFTKNECRFLKMTIECAFKLACAEDSVDPDDLSDFSTGMRIIEAMSQTIQSKYFFPLCSDYINKLITSNEINFRKAAVNSLGAIVEGCCEKIKEILEQVVQTLVNICLNDTSIVVRTEAIIAIDNLTQFCEPEINEYHMIIIPMLMQGLSSNNDDMIEKCLIELNYFCKNLDVELEDYVNDLLPRLIILLENHKSVNIQKECLFALASIISSAHNLINSTLFPILETCRSIIINRTSEDEIELRANSLDCVAHIAFAIKKEKFLPYMQFFTNFATECINCEKYEFQEAGFTYFGIIATLLGQEITNDLQVLLNRALAILEDDSGVKNEKVKDEFAIDSDSDDGNSDNSKIDDVFVNNSFINAKCATILAITRFAQASPCEFLTHIQNVLVHFESLWDYINDQVNYELISAYQAILISVKMAEEQMSKQMNLNHSESLAKKMWTIEVFPKYEKIVQESDVKEEIVRVLEGLYDLVEQIGKNLFVDNNTLERMMKLCVLLLDNKATCQVKNDDDEDDPDHDEKILGGVVDIFLITSEKLGNDFHSYFSSSFNSLKKYISVKRSENDRSMILGCIADVLKNCKISTKFYIEILFSSCEENIKRNSKKKYADLYRHVAYLLGVLFESDPSTAKPYFVKAIELLQIIFEASASVAKDNVIAALCRICIGLNLNAQECVLFPKIIETICLNCPLNFDSLENPCVFKFFQFLTDKLDMKGYELYLERILNTLKMLILNEIKCGTSKVLIKEIKDYLEYLSTNEILKNAIQKFVDTMSEKERDRFVNTISNI